MDDPTKLPVIETSHCCEFDITWMCVWHHMDASDRISDHMSDHLDEFHTTYLCVSHHTALCLTSHGCESLNMQLCVCHHMDKSNHMSDHMSDHMVNSTSHGCVLAVTWLDAAGELLDTLPPGIDEAVAISKVVQFLKSPEYSHFQHIVFDTAPTGHTLRLLTLPDFLDKTIGRSQLHNARCTHFCGALCGNLRHQ